jgi:hypothetical protein
MLIIHLPSAKDGVEGLLSSLSFPPEGVFIIFSREASGAIYSSLWTTEYL